MLSPLTHPKLRPGNLGVAPDGPAAALRERLSAALADAIEGEVRFDAGSRALYATDASNYRQVPIGVVVPKSMEDVEKTVALCRRYEVPVLSRGAGTSLCGQCCNVAVVIDFSKYLNRIVRIDPERRLAEVEPGVVLDDLREAAEKFHLTFAPDPATHNHNTLGGMLGNNSCGPHSVMGGKTVENVVELEVLTYDGLRMRVGETSEADYRAILAEGGRRAELYRRLMQLRDAHAEGIRARIPDIPRRVSGFNLRALLPERGFNLAQALVGSEGTCVVVLSALVRLVDSPPCRNLLVLGYPDVYRAADDVEAVMAHGPIALEGIDDRLVEDMRKLGMHPRKLELLPPGAGWLLVEFGGDSGAQAEARARRLMRHLEARDDAPSMALYDDPEEMHQLWKVRESGLGATAHVPGEPLTWEGWEDSAVPPAQLGAYLRELRALFDAHGYGCDLYGHFGQGCVHTRIDFDLESAEGIARYRRFLHEAAQLVARFGGSISGEHGDGQSKAELLPIMFGAELVAAFHDFKRIWDPAGRMNPGKVVDAFRVDENLRLGPGYRPASPPTHFRYPEEGGDFARTLLRCVGVGECRKKSGVMCPSYMATGEEMHSTRGRAHLLFEMLRGEVLTEGWRDPAVKEALDLCLSCRGCKRECPVDVDMATYKAEFLAHYYEGRLRPPTAYAFGFIDRWARLGARMPALANWLIGGPLAGLGKRIAGVHPARDIPRLARRPFTREHRPARGPGERVILWPDTFNNYFYPRTAAAAAEVLRAVGCEVALPARPLCCGRPLYEFGMLDTAKRYLRTTLDTLAADIDAGTPVVGLEPACMSVFREELPALFPDDARATLLARQAFLLSDYLERRHAEFAWSPLGRDAIVHAHCHHSAVFGTEAAESLLRKAGVNYRLLDSGCCGMAGSFGFERDKYAVSLRCAERVLMPAVRAARADTLVLADGFSCREQIRQLNGAETLHLAELLRLALPG